MNRQAGSMFRIIVGGYLVYLGMNLISAVVKEKPENMVLMIIFGAAFIVFGGGYALFSLKRMFDESKREREAAAEEEEAAEEETEDPAEETQSGPKSLTERARMLAGFSEEEEEEAGETVDEEPALEESPEEEIENDYEEK